MRRPMLIPVAVMRLVLDTPTSGYITALIRNERIKFFTVSGIRRQVTDTSTTQVLTGFNLKLTQAGANYVNKGLKRKALKRFSQFGTMDLRLIKPPAASGSAPGHRDRHRWRRQARHRHVDPPIDGPTSTSTRTPARSRSAAA